MSADFWAGYISGAAGIIIGNPLDLLKVRLQSGTHVAAHSYSSQFPTTSSLIRGATAPILGYGALNALLFMTYNRSAALLNPPSSTAPSSWTTFLAGAIGGLATWVVSTPTELVKCRAQMSTVPISSLSILRTTLQAEGIRGMYFGGTVTALRDSIGYGFYFWSYELSTRTWARKFDTESIVGNAAKVLICGGLAGVITWASVFPLDVIKTRVQTQVWDAERSPLIVARSAPEYVTQATGRSGSVVARTRIGAMEMARRTYREEGSAVFFRGLTVCTVRAFIVNAVQWAVYEWIMKELNQGTGKAGASKASTV